MTSTDTEPDDVAAETPLDEAQEKPRLALTVKVDEKSTCERHITVTIPREDIDRYMREAFDDLKPKAEVPGFRPGRAPRKLVESRFKEQVAGQVKGSLLLDSMTQVTDEAEFSAISEPDFDFEAVEMPDEGPLTFEFDIEVRPEFELPKWDGLSLERPTKEYGESDVDEHLKKLLSRYGEVVTHDGAAKADDYVVIDVQFEHDGKTLSELKDVKVRLRKNLSFSDGKLEDFSKLLSKAKAGAVKEAKVKLSDDVDDEALRGKEVDCRVTLKEVQKLELPKLDRAFLDKIGGFQDEQELRDEVKKELERQLRYHQQRALRQQITSQLTKTANWQLPPDLLRRQSRRELQRYVLELQSSGFSNEEIQAHANELRQNSMASTATALKEHFILERIAEEKEFDASPEDYEKEIWLIAAQSNESPRRVRARLEKQGQMDSLRNQIIEGKVIDLITEAAKIKDVPLKTTPEDTSAVDHAIIGGKEKADIPEAKHGGDAADLPEQVDRT